jgi:excisionase family DNA binding protein
MTEPIIFMNKKDVLTVCEAAYYLNVSTKTVYGLIYRKELEAIRIGSRYKITAESIRRYLSKNSVR